MGKSLFRGSRKILLYAVMVLLVFSFSACGTAANTAPSDSAQQSAGGAAQAPETTADPSSQSSEPIKLTVWLATTGDAKFDDTYKKILDEYTASHPNVSFESAFITWAEYFTKLNTGLVGGAGPDIFMSGYGQMGTLQANSSLLALDSYIPGDWEGYSDFNANILNICKGADGKLYALFSPSTRSFTYRKDIAAKNGVTGTDLDIKTQEDLLNLARKLTVRDSNGKVKTYGLEIDPDQEQTFFVYASQLSRDPFNLWNKDLTGNLNAEQGVKAMQNLYGLYKEGVVMLMDPSATSPAISQGTAAMSMGPDTYYSLADAAFPGQIGIVKNEMNTLLIGNYIVVNAATKYKDVSADVLLDLFSKDSCQVLAETNTQYSGRKSLDDAFAKLNPDFANLVYSYQRSFPYSDALNPKYTQCATAFRTSLDSIFQGTDAKKALDAAEDIWNSTVKE